jgi:hypothetical protein
VHGDVISFVALDLILWIAFSAVMHITFVLHVVRVFLDDNAFNVSGFGVPSDMVSNSELLNHSVPSTLPLQRAGQLVRYICSALRPYWVIASSAAGRPETLSFQTAMKSGLGWNRLGCCAVRYCASALTALGLPLVTDAWISPSAWGLW